MLLKELLQVISNNQRCKLSFIKNNDILDVKGTASYLLNEYDYLLDHEVMCLYVSKNNLLCICL